MRYRPEVDGLRAIAVISVILFHAGFSFFSGGFIGVDIFFVISGYLITSIILDNLQNENFSFLEFYRRRAQRILPALVFVVTVSTVVAWVLLNDASLERFGKGLTGISLFISNIIFSRQQGYFDESSELNPLLHTWSLSIEEQYYLLFPITAVVIWYLFGRRFILVVGALFLASFTYAMWKLKAHQIDVFFSAPGRAWEILAGSFVAVIAAKKAVRPNPILASTGLLLVGLAILKFNKDTPSPSEYMLIPVIGTAVFLLFGSGNMWLSRLLSSRIPVGVGLMSYSLYLWHQPLFAFARVKLNRVDVGLAFKLGLIGATFIFAFLSWQLVEKPFRARTIVSAKRVLALAAMSLALIFGLGRASMSVASVEVRSAELLVENDWVYFSNMDEREFVRARLTYPMDPVKTVVLGSSRVMGIDSLMLGEPIQSLTVSGASIEDDVAFGMEAHAVLGYSKVLISADPWILNVNDGQDRYLTVEDLYDFWRSRLTPGLDAGTYPETGNYSRENDTSSRYLRAVRTFLKATSSEVPQSSEIEATAKKTKDGTHIYGSEFEYRQYAQSDSLSALNYAMKDFAFDSQAARLLEDFATYLTSRGVQVVLVLTPYHPEAYALMRGDNAIFAEIEEWYESLAMRIGITSLGSYDPAAVGCSEQEFYDGMHPKRSCMEKVVLVSTSSR